MLAIKAQKCILRHVHPLTRTLQAMGRDQDSVFVDNERTARDAITYLKDQKVPSMTFVPLATCKVRLCVSLDQGSKSALHGVCAS
eukprot:1159481-Pelagomonas_calceolata.AAC.9